MRTMQRLARFGFGAFALLSGCARDVTSPATPRIAVAGGPENIKINPPIVVQALERSKPLARAEVRSQVVGPHGGKIQLSRSDFELIIPRGALSAPTRITVTALPGKAIAYEFEPHGLTFNVPLVFSQKLGHSTWKNVEGGKAEGAYFTTPDLLDQHGMTATVAEVFPLTLDVIDSKVRFEVPHFSGYMVTSGRQSR